MTAQVLGPSVLERSTVVGFDFVQQAALAAVTHHGGRPWRLSPVDRGVELRVEGLRGVPSAGVGGQTVRIAAGMALLNMRLAVAAGGNCPVTVLFPDRTRTRVLAVLRSGAVMGPTPADRALFGAVWTADRWSVAEGSGPVPWAVVNGLRGAAETERAWLRSVVDPGERARIAERIPGVGEDGSSLFVVGSNHDARAAHVHVGQAAQRIVLTSAVLGYAASVVAWPADVRGVGPLPLSVGGPGLFPQLLMLVGRPTSA